MRKPPAASKGKSSAVRGEYTGEGTDETEEKFRRLREANPMQRSPMCTYYAEVVVAGVALVDPGSSATTMSYELFRLLGVSSS